MADIFLSYAREDIKKAELLASALESQGWTVFWDRTSLLAGQEFEAIIEQAIQQAGCMIVAWSEASKQSDWVRGEASIGRERNILVPILFEPAKPPIAFRTLHTENLAGWEGDTDEPDFLKLCQAINNCIKPKTAANTDSTPPNQHEAKAIADVKAFSFKKSLKNTWNWLTITKHQQTLAFIGSGLIILITGSWQAYLHFSEQAKETKPTMIVTDSGSSHIEQTTKGDSSPVIVNKIPFKDKTVKQKTEGKNSPAIISGGDVSVTSGQ